MVAESRVKKSLLNARINLIFYFLILTLSFFSRKIFLDALGADFVGLTSTLQNLLGFLNLAELGIGTAIGYVLYKPLFDQDHDKISEIISVFGYLYSWIGKIILVAGCILACFLPLIFSNTGFELALIYFAYFSFLASSLIGYFVNYKQTLLGADQKNYVVTAYFQTATIIKTLIQMVSAYYTDSYYLWVVIELLFGIVYSFILNWKINQTYPWLKSEIRLGKYLLKKYPEVMRYTKQLFVHKLALFAQYQTTPIFIYSFTTLHLVTYYGNYTLLVDKITNLIKYLFGSVDAGIGNLIAEGNKQKILRVFWELYAAKFFIACVSIYGILILMEPFISLWLGNKYVLPRSIFLLILINNFINLTRGTADQFIFGFGLFSDTWSSVVQSIMFIGGSIIGGYCYGIEGILYSSIISCFFIVICWKPYFLFTKGFNMSFVRYYWYSWIKYNIIGIVSFVLCFNVKLPFLQTNDWTSFIVFAVVQTVIYVVVIIILLSIFSQGFRDFLIRIYKLVKNK